MKIEFLKEKLEDVISFVEKIASKNLSLPVLQCVLLTAEKNNLSIRSTNLDLGVEIKIPVKVLKDGSVAVPAETLKRFLSTINDKNTILEEEKDGLRIHSQSVSAKIKTLPADDFPTLPKINNKNSFFIDGKNFSEGLQSVWYSASPTSLKPELSSVYISKVSSGLVFAATDSFRLAEKKIFGISENELDSILIPFKNVNEIIKFLNTSDRKVEVKIGDNQISFSTQDSYITSRIIDGIFPDYTQIIPKKFSTEIIILKQDIVDALKTSQVFVNKFNQIYFSINPSEKKFNLYSKNEDIGENSYELKSTITGDPIEISFNYRYIMDCFQSILQDSVSFKFSGEGKPMVISGVGDESFTYLIMPMNR